nr:hypothetical protein [Kingella denitrificans]
MKYYGNFSIIIVLFQVPVRFERAFFILSASIPHEKIPVLVTGCLDFGSLFIRAAETLRQSIPD